MKRLKTVVAIVWLLCTFTLTSLSIVFAFDTEIPKENFAICILWTIIGAITSWALIYEEV